VKPFAHRHFPLQRRARQGLRGSAVLVFAAPFIMYNLRFTWRQIRRQRFRFEVMMRRYGLLGLMSGATFVP
jgi:hypothetical protein